MQLNEHRSPQNRSDDAKVVDIRDGVVLRFPLATLLGTPSKYKASSKIASCCGHMQVERFTAGGVTGCYQVQPDLGPLTFYHFI